MNHCRSERKDLDLRAAIRSPSKSPSNATIGLSNLLSMCIFFEKQELKNQGSRLVVELEYKTK